MEYGEYPYPNAVRFGPQQDSGPTGFALIALLPAALAFGRAPPSDHPSRLQSGRDRRHDRRVGLRALSRRHPPPMDRRAARPDAQPRLQPARRGRLFARYRQPARRAFHAGAGRRPLRDSRPVPDRRGGDASGGLHTRQPRVQHYLTTLPDGRIVVLPPSWDVEKREWFHNLDIVNPDEAATNPIQVEQPMPRLSRVGRGQGLRRASNRYATRWQDAGTSCERCHGPGAAHAARHTHPADSPAPTRLSCRRTSAPTDRRWCARSVIRCAIRPCPDSPRAGTTSTTSCPFSSSGRRATPRIRRTGRTAAAPILE